ncbi:MAG: FAD-dependent monooxygenase [Gammaproteobacteria bacterium]|nr:FAD-dependent monooxygenase [Gammaproteobacteria bacterium]
MINVPVCIIGCGPIGLAGALLLARFGVRSLVVERRDEVNTHPRSRFVDTNTMELMRFLGLEKAVEGTGLGPDWTEYNRWFSTLTGQQIAAIPSPTFHTVPRNTSPTMPVMTCQDYVEHILLGEARANERVELRYRTEALEVTQDADGATVVVRDLDSGQESAVRADYALGTDGPHSSVREAIGSALETAPLATFSQDVIFEADLSEYVAGRKGGLLYNAAPSGMLVFQPLNGVTRWRCQIPKADPEPLTQAETIARIREAVGTDDEVPISITSTGMWQPTPGCVDRLSRGRVFLAGDAAHISVPTGGMGNNIGFAGIRNLAWKIAYVLKGVSPPGILDTYHVEHRPIALERVATGVHTTECMARIFFAFYAGQETSEAVRDTAQYADYDGVLLGFELESALIAKNPEPPPAVNNPTRDFVPAVRAGRRAPHVWVDERRNWSVLDWFGMEYALVGGASVAAGRWREAVRRVAENAGFPVCWQQLPGPDAAPYDPFGLALVLRDGIIADWWSDADVGDSHVEARLRERLPLRESVSTG